MYGREDPDMMAAFEGCTHSGGKGKKLRKASKRPARSLGTTQWVKFVSHENPRVYILLIIQKMFNGETDDLAAKPYIPQKKLLQ